MGSRGYEPRGRGGQGAEGAHRLWALRTLVWRRETQSPSWGQDPGPRTDSWITETIVSHF